jgi:hypothetical protein
MMFYKPFQENPHQSGVKHWIQTRGNCVAEKADEGRLAQTVTVLTLINNLPS